MTFLAPAAAALAITLPVIVALYFLRIRRPTRVVPALHLWPSQIRDRQANVPWQRLRPSWLLFLQLLAAAALVAAAVQPVLPAGASLARHSIVLLDASASMQATDVTPSRLAEAKRQVNAVIDQRRQLLSDVQSVNPPTALARSAALLKASLVTALSDDLAVQAWIQAKYSGDAAAASAAWRRNIAISEQATKAKDQFLTIYNAVRKRLLGLAPLDVAY